MKSAAAIRNGRMGRSRRSAGFQARLYLESSDVDVNIDVSEVKDIWRVVR